MSDRQHAFATRDEVVLAARKVIEVWDRASEGTIKRAAAGHVRHMLSIARASTPGQRRERLHRAIHSPACRLSAAILAWKGRARPLTYFNDVADEANIRRSQTSQLQVRVMGKPDGGFRAISSFGHVDGTKQLLLREILLAKFGHSLFEHARAGRGRDTVVREIIRSLEEGEVNHLIEADIKDCFPSVKRGALSAFLGLPSSVIRNTVAIGPNTSISISHNHIHPISEQRVRAGLPLGSRVTPLIMSMLVEKALCQIDGPLRLSYVDNIWLGAKSEAEAAAKKDVLAVLLKQHPAGPFTLKYNYDLRIDDYNNVLGYWVREQTAGYPGRARATPSPWAMLKAQRELATALTFHVPGPEMDAVVDAWASAWCNSFGVWGGRMNGQTAAFHDGYDHVWQHQKQFAFRFKDVRFSSFLELMTTAEQFAHNLPLNPHYRPFGWLGKFPSVSPH